MSASAKMNLPHVAIYYANIINIIYSLCEKLKKKNVALGSPFFGFFFLFLKAVGRTRESPLGVTQSLAFFGQAASDSWRNAWGGKVVLPHFSCCPCLLIVAKENKVSGSGKLGKKEQPKDTQSKNVPRQKHVRCHVTLEAHTSIGVGACCNNMSFA